MLKKNKKYWYRMHLKYARLNMSRSWCIPKEIRNEKKLINLMNTYIKTKEIIYGKIRQAVDAGYIKDISKCSKRCVGGRPRIAFKRAD